MSNALLVPSKKRTAIFCRASLGMHSNLTLSFSFLPTVFAEFCFLVAFVFEMGIRLFALGPYVYFSSAFNRFDCAVITGSIFEVILVNCRERQGAFGLSGLRALRLLRVFKVTK